MRITTWNVNSLRVRLPQVLDWLRANPVDAIGLQELKLHDDIFPYADFETLGYHAVTNGQKTYNGVAILSRKPLTDVSRDMPGFADDHRRVIAATVEGVRLVNVYVPNGQAVGSGKYAYKLRWLAAFRDYLRAEVERWGDVVVTGDFNVAPAPEDTHDPAQWEGNILCSEAERQGFRDLLATGLEDCFRLFAQPEKTFTWWDYRQAGFRRNLGLRIDHVLASAALARKCQSCQVDTAPRRAERPSDHAPVTALFERAAADPVPESPVTVLSY